MSKSGKISRHEKFRFFMEALKAHLQLYGWGVVFMLAFSVLGYLALWGGPEPDKIQSVAGIFFLVDAVAVAVLVFYLNMSGMQDDYASAMLKKYGRCTTATVTDVSFEADHADGIIRCFVSVDYAGHLLTELIELPDDQAHLLDRLQRGKHVPIRVVDGVPATLRIAPRELFSGPENGKTRFWNRPARSSRTKQPAHGLPEQSPRQKNATFSPTLQVNP